MESTTKDLQEPLLCTMDTDNSMAAAVIYDTTTSTATTPRSHRQEGPVWMCCGFPCDPASAESWHRSLAAAFMTFMLWLQFRVACGVPQSPIHMDAALVLQIGSFGLAGVLFRSSLLGTETTAVQLWPEISTDGLLFIILLGYTTEAVWLMNLLTLSQCLHAAWNYWDMLQQHDRSCRCCDDDRDTAATTTLDRTLHVRGRRPLRPLAGFRKLDEDDCAAVAV